MMIAVHVGQLVEPGAPGVQVVELLHLVIRAWIRGVREEMWAG